MTTPNKPWRRTLTNLTLTTYLLVHAPHAFAVLTENLTIGNARALALANAVTADPPGIDSIHFNPAGLARLSGHQQETKYITGSFDIGLKFGSGYTDSWTQHLNDANVNSPPNYIYDEARGQTSQTSGATLMLPLVGLTDLPILAGIVGGASYSPPKSGMTFATSVYSPMAVGFSREKNDPGRFIGQSLAFSVISYFSPSFAYQLTPTLALGGSISFNYAGIGMQLPYREPNLALQWIEKLRQDTCNGETSENEFSLSDLIPCIEDNEAFKLYDEVGYLSFEVNDGLTFGTNVGALWRATPWLTVGAVYQSAVEMNMSGDFRWTQGESFLNLVDKINSNLPINLAAYGVFSSLLEPRTEGKAELKMTMPDHFSLGTSLQITPRIKLNTDFKYTRWSEWKDFTVHYSDPIALLVIANLIHPEGSPPPIGQTLSLPLNFQDTWNTSFGLEYQWTDRIALLMGIEDRPTSIPKASTTPVLPIGNAILYSLGAEFHPDTNSTFDLAIATMKSHVNVPGNTSKTGNSEDPRMLIYNPYSGSDIDAQLNVLLLELCYRHQW